MEISMGRKVIYECDMAGCEQTRKPSNHWFLAENIESLENQYSQIRIYPFTEKMAEVKSEISKDGMKVLCGEACVHKYISQSLASLHPLAPYKHDPETCTCLACNETRANDEYVVIIPDLPTIKPPDLHGGNVTEDDIPW
jgi:hypothetical protein